MSKVQDFIAGNLHLPSPPAVALKILQAVRTEDSSFEDIAEIIMADPSLTAKVLKVANSSLYGISGGVDSLSQATALIGTDALRNIALSFVIIDNFQELQQEVFDIDLFWRRAVISAVAAETLGKKLGHEGKDIFVAALLQDLGVLIMFLAEPARYVELRDEKRLTEKPLRLLERELFGFDHTLLGYTVMKEWNLPKTIILPILHHHHPSRGEQFEDIAKLLGLAGDISSLFSGVNLQSKIVAVQSVFVDEYGWSTQRFEDQLDIIGERAREMLQLFEIDPAETKPLSELMDAANEEVGQQNLSYKQVAFELQFAKNSAERLAKELKNANKSIRELVERDGLTGLYNHGYFQDILQLELARSDDGDHPLSLMLLDIDNFKQLNEKYGYKAGDLFLRRFAEELVKLVRHCDVVARYGGDEFAIILPETTLTRTRVLAQRVRRGIEQLVVQNGLDNLVVTVSIGIVSTDAMSQNTITHLLITELVDQALYRAKQLGRNRVEV